MVWVSFYAPGPSRLAGMNCINEHEHVMTSAPELSLKRKWVMQLQRLKQMTFNQRMVKIVSSDLNRIEIFWEDLKQTVHVRKPTNTLD